MRSKLARVTVETVIPCLVGTGLVGYVLFRCGRGAARVLHELFVEFVSG